MRALNRHNKKRRKVLFSLLSAAIITAFIFTVNGDAVSGSGSAPSMADYTAFPPIGGTVVKPNILLNLDNSASQNYFAYDFNYNALTVSKNRGSNGGELEPPVSEGFKPDKKYYGYFDPDRWYNYSNGEFFIANRGMGRWSGNFLNWLTMRRVDVIKRALIGGKTKSWSGSDAGNHPNDLLGQTAHNKYEGYQKQVSLANARKFTSYTGTSNPVVFTFNNDWDGNQDNQNNQSSNNQQQRQGMWRTRPPVAAFCMDSTQYSETCAAHRNVIVHLGNNETPEGVFQRVGDKARWGLELIDDGTVPRMQDMPCERIETGRPMGGGNNNNNSNSNNNNSNSNGSMMDIPNVTGGSVVVPVGYYNGNVEIYSSNVPIKRKDAIVKWIASVIPNTPATPIAESLWTATGYFQQVDQNILGKYGPRYYNEQTKKIPEYIYGSYPVSNAADKFRYDPYNYAANPGTDPPRRLPCASSFVITITDGEPTQDQDLPLSRVVEFETTYSDGRNPVPFWADDTSTLLNGSLRNYFWDQDDLKGSHYVDDVALWSHVDIGRKDYRDLRGDLPNGADYDGDGRGDYPQYLTHFFIYAKFGGGTPDGERLLNWSRGWLRPGGGGAARNGGFIELSDSKNFVPDKKGEYNSDGDKADDTFYEANDGYQLEAALTNAIYIAFKRAASGTSASLITNTASGEGAVYQAYFYPQKFEGNEIRKWLGHIYAIFVDKYGNLRDDGGTPGKLDDDDPVIKIEYSVLNGTEVYKCSTTDNGKTYSCPPTPAGGLESIRPIWDGGRWLWDNTQDVRKIYTTLSGYDFTTGGLSVADDLGNFYTANSAALQPYLRAADNDGYQEAGNIINWIRGDDLTGVTDAGHPDGYRKRSITSKKPWKLGDIVYSSPTPVGKPMENYDLLYGDASYSEFRKAYLNRRQVVYAGANDGMLHAFNAGCYDETTNQFTNNCPDGKTSYELGQELWAFIPRGLLPHLKWLTDPDYTHVYYVDLKPKITDVKIFSTETHINGWGTILIGGFRYGGKKIEWTSGGNQYSASPEYFALDITDPVKPRLLWTFSDPDLGLSMSYPAVAKIGNRWYAVFGSGAAGYSATSDLKDFQDGRVFVLDISSGNNGVVQKWSEGQNFWKIDAKISNAFMSSPITVDVNIDYNVDVAYIGGNYTDAKGNPNAIMFRITTTGSDPSQWKLSPLGDVTLIAGVKDDAKRITSAPSAAMDDMTNLWIYFGTGQFLGTSDKNRTDTGAFYAIKDRCWDGGNCPPSYPAPDLIDISGSAVAPGGTVGTVTGVTGCSDTDTVINSWSTLITASNNCDGWVLYYKRRGELQDFTGQALARYGERSLSKPLVFGGLVTWGTYIPGKDECASDKGENHAYSVYYKTGTAFKYYVFDEQKEQAENGNASGLVARTKKLKITHPPAPPSAQITSKGTVKIFFPGGETAISGIETNTPLALKSALAGCKNAEIP